VRNNGKILYVKCVVIQRVAIASDREEKLQQKCKKVNKFKIIAWCIVSIITIER
jgi:hypothetical protein